MRVAHREREDVLADEGEDVLDRHPLLGHRLLEQRRARADLSEDGARGQLRAMIGNGVGGQITDPADFVRREIE